MFGKRGVLDIPDLGGSIWESEKGNDMLKPVWWGAKIKNKVTSAESKEENVRNKRNGGSQLAIRSLPSKWTGEGGSIRKE